MRSEGWGVRLGSEVVEGGKEGGREGVRGAGGGVQCAYTSTQHSSAPAEVLVPCHLMDRMLWAQCTVHYNGTIHMYTACLYTGTCYCTGTVTRHVVCTYMCMSTTCM